MQCGNKAPVTSAVGTISLNGDEPINVNSLSQIGSITKSFTSVVLLQLTDESQYNFSLSDTIGKYFPEYPQWKNITVIQLLNMSSGIQNYTTKQEPFRGFLQDPYIYMSPESMVKMVESLPLMFTLGAGYLYSNTNTVLAGMLIERITHNSPILEIQNRIFNKLNLKNTYFPKSLPESEAPLERLINGYGYFAPPLGNGLYNTTLWQLSWAYTAGAIISNPTDINIYVHALFKPGQLLNQRQITSLTGHLTQATSPYQQIADVSESSPYGFALNILKVYAPAPSGNSYNYTGGTAGFMFDFMYYPELDMSIVFTTNSSQSGYSLADLKQSLFEYTVTTQCGKNIPYYKPTLVD